MFGTTNMLCLQYFILVVTAQEIQKSAKWDRKKECWLLMEGQPFNFSPKSNGFDIGNVV